MNTSHDDWPTQRRADEIKPGSFIRWVDYTVEVIDVELGPAKWSDAGRRRGGAFVQKRNDVYLTFRLTDGREVRRAHYYADELVTVRA